MTTIVAVNGLSSAGGYLNPNVSVALRGFTVDYWPPHAADTGLFPVSVDTDKVFVPTQPINNLVTYNATHYFEDFYFHLWIRPITLDLGNLLSSQTRTVELWNSFLTPVHVESIELSGTQGITLTPPEGYADVPFTLAPNQSISYVVHIDTAGPPNIDAGVTWTATEDNVTLRVLGSRVTLFPFAPDWANGIDETIAARSMILRSANGTEQSINLWEQYRRSYQITYMLKGVDAQLFSNLLFGWQGRLYGLPLWPEMGYLVSPIAPGGLRVDVPTAGRTFVPGSVVMLRIGRGENAGRYEVREIDSVDATGLVLKTPVAGQWVVGAQVIPTAVAMLSQTLQWAYQTPRVIQTAIQFNCEPSQTDPLMPVVAPAALYRGYELYRGITNWRSGTAASSTSDALIRDLNNAIFDLMPQAGYSPRGRTHNWMFKTLEEVLDFRAWLRRRKGKTFGVWMHSAIDDFDMVLTTFANRTDMTVKTNGYVAYANLHAARRDVYIETYAGQWYARRITDAADSEGGTTVLHIDTPLGVDVAPEEIKRFCFLSFYRLATDESTVHWHAPGKAEAATGLLPTKSLA